jgi:hypothetical protein
MDSMQLDGRTYGRYGQNLGQGLENLSKFVKIIDKIVNNSLTAYKAIRDKALGHDSGGLLDALRAVKGL